VTNDNTMSDDHNNPVSAEMLDEQVTEAREALELLAELAELLDEVNMHLQEVEANPAQTPYVRFPLERNEEGNYVPGEGVLVPVRGYVGGESDIDPEFLGKLVKSAGKLLKRVPWKKVAKVAKGAISGAISGAAGGIPGILAGAAIGGIGSATKLGRSSRQRRVAPARGQSRPTWNRQAWQQRASDWQQRANQWQPRQQRLPPPPMHTPPTVASPQAPLVLSQQQLNQIVSQLLPALRAALGRESLEASDVMPYLEHAVTTRPAEDHLGAVEELLAELREARSAIMEVFAGEENTTGGPIDNQ
jgi:hypothetical protein